MTTLNSAIARAEQIEALMSARIRILAMHGIDIMGIYCSATGRQIASIDDDSMLQINPTLTDGELIELTLLAARPSHAWIVKRRECYTRLRETDPVGLLTHLICSIFDAMESAHKRRNFEGKVYSTLWATTAARVDFMRCKIALRRAISELPEDKRQLALDRAIELDARKGLETIMPPHRMTLAILIEDFLPRLANLLQHCEDELREARKLDSKAGNYFSRQAANLTVDPLNPKVTVTHKAKAARVDEDLFASLIMEEAGIGGLDDLRQLNESIRNANSATRKAQQAQAAALPTGASLAASFGVVVSKRRVEEYLTATNQTKIITGGSIKL